MADSSITSVQNRGDGNMYYVIGGESSDAAKHIVKVNTIAERNALTKVTGFVLVRNAYKDDPTVNRGWAIYIADGTTTTTTSRSWIKVIEEESVEGSWGSLAEVLESLASKAALSALENKNAADHAKYDQYGERITSVEAKQHSHDNKDVLDRLTDVYGQLHYRGVPVGGGAYVYEKINESGLYWEDPTGASPTEQVSSSTVIAEKFCGTSIAYAGQTLQVIETDHSVSSFVLFLDGDNLFPKFVGSVGGVLANNASAMRFVVALPEPSSIYAGQGYFCLIPPGYCGNKVGHIYECVNEGLFYAWHDISDDNDVAPVDGPKLRMCIRDTWSDVRLVWTNPDYKININEGSEATEHYVKWSKTIIVRKFGSTPRNKEDGTVVGTITDYNVTSLIDSVPHSHLNVFYAIFAETTSGAVYRNAVSVDDEELHTAKAEFPTWEHIGQLIDSGYANKLLSVGDIIILPEHRDYGTIECKIIDIDGGNIVMQATHAIDTLPLDGPEYVYLPADGTTFKEGTTYLLLTKNSSGQVTFTEVLGSDLDYDVYVESGKIKANMGVFTLPRNTDTNVYDPAGDKKIHGSLDWSTSNLNQWLNANTVDWFQPKPALDMDGNVINKADGTPLTFDRNGIDRVYGFLNGFKDSDSAAMNGFLRRISKVGIPRDTDVIGAWVEGGMISMADGNKGGSYPEDAHLVVPVITFSAKVGD